MPKISVIVPVFGEKKWLAECLSSIKTRHSMELIVQSDPEGTGAANARNQGLKRADGEYVMFCDSDDYLEPGAIDLLLESVDNDADLVCGSFRKFGEFEMTVTHPTRTFTQNELAEYVLSSLRSPGKHQMLSGCWAKLFKREFIEDFPDLVTAEDMAFNFDYLSRCKKVKFLENMVYHNRKRQGSLSTSFKMKDKSGLFGFLEGLKRVKKFLEPFYSEAEIEDALDSSKVYHSMLYFSRMAGCGRDTFKRLYP